MATSAFLGLKCQLPVMRRLGRGVFVNAASVSGLACHIGMPAYNAAKVGVVNLTRAAALECASQGVRVNCICSGAASTRVSRRRWPASAPTRLCSSPARLVADGGLTAGTGLPPFTGP